MRGRVRSGIRVLGGELVNVARRLREGARLPLRSEETVLTIIVGTLFWYLNILIVPALLVIGFMIRLLEEGTSHPEPQRTYPDFDRWGRLLVDGSRGFLIWFTYLTLPWTLIQGEETVGNDTTTIEFLGFVAPNPPNIVLVGLSQFVEPDLLTRVAEDILNQPVPDLTQEIPFLERVIIAVGDPLSVGLVDTAAYTTVEFYVLMLVVLYITPAALANFASADKRIIDGFDFPVIRLVILDWRYLVNWSVVILLLVTSATLIEYSRLVLSGVYFYLWGVGYYVIADVWRELEPQTIPRRVSRLESRVERLRSRFRGADGERVVDRTRRGNDAKRKETGGEDSSEST